MRVRLYHAFSGEPVKDTEFTVELVASEVLTKCPGEIREIYSELLDDLKHRGRTSLGWFYEVRRLVPSASNQQRTAA